MLNPHFASRGIRRALVTSPTSLPCLAARYAA